MPVAASLAVHFLLLLLCLTGLMLWRLDSPNRPLQAPEVISRWEETGVYLPQGSTAAGMPCADHAFAALMGYTDFVR